MADLGSYDLLIFRGSYYVARSPTDTFPYTNCLAVHPSDFPRELVHVLVNGYPLTVRYVKSNHDVHGLYGYQGTTMTDNCEKDLLVYLFHNDNGSESSWVLRSQSKFFLIHRTSMHRHSSRR